MNTPYELFSPIKVTQKGVADAILKYQAFDLTTGSLFARWSNKLLGFDGDRYGVFSYTLNWPLYVYEGRIGQWFSHDQKCSLTTSRHKRLAAPVDMPVMILPGPYECQFVFDHGYNALAQRRIRGEL